MYIDDYRNFDEDQDFYEFDDMNQLYNLETYDLPNGCPYRQMVPPPFSGPGALGGPAAQNSPSGPPPNFTPAQAQGYQGGIGVKAIDPGSIRPCLYRFVYIWPKRGRGFWAWLTFVGRRSASGFRWNGFRWVYFGIDLQRIESFTCY
jgi:hypothetical protein